MKRFKVDVDYSGDIIKGKLTESLDGECVLYLDVEGMVEGVPLFCDKGECNCAEKAEKLIRDIDHLKVLGDKEFIENRDSFNVSWICLAHGYKKL